MTVSRCLFWSGVSIVLAACGSSLALGSDESGQSTPPVPTSRSIPASHYDAVAPPAYVPAVRRCTPACNCSRGIFGWFRRKPAVCPTAECDALYSGCNVHPEPPFGASYHATMQTQIAKGEAALMVLYQFDFLPGEAALSYRGRLRLQKISKRLPRNPFPVVIEASRHDRALDQARQRNVAAELANMPFPVPAERIVVGLPPARGLDGLDAELIHHNLLGLTAQGAVSGQPAAAGTGVTVPSPR